MKVWITKYALTQGIFDVEAELCEGGNMVEVPGNPEERTFTAYYHGEGKDWHRTRESAVKRACLKRDIRLRTLAAQIAKLKKKTF